MVVAGARTYSTDAARTAGGSARQHLVAHPAQRGTMMESSSSSAPQIDGGGIGVSRRHCRREPDVVTKVATGDSSDTVNDAGGGRRGTGATSTGGAADEVERRRDSR
jgi:hypothetical protein